MAAKERVSYSVVCPDCGQKGTVNTKENDHIYMTSVDLTIEGVEGRFDAEKKGDSDLKITCRDCSATWSM